MPSNLISKKKMENAAWLDKLAIDAGQRSGFLSHKEKKVSKYGEKNNNNNIPCLSKTIKTLNRTQIKYVGSECFADPVIVKF